MTDIKEELEFPENKTPKPYSIERIQYENIVDKTEEQQRILNLINQVYK